MIIQAPLAQAPLAQAPLAIFMFFKFFAEAPLAEALLARLLWLGSFGPGSFDSQWYLIPITYIQMKLRVILIKARES